MMSNRRQTTPVGLRARRALVEGLEPRLLLASVYDLPVGAPPMVRVGYVIPSNRSPQPQGAATLQAALPRMQQWYRDQMDRYGLGAKSFVYETESDGSTPKVHVISVSATDTALNPSGATDLTIYNNTLNAALGAGVPLLQNGQVWLLIPECHIQRPDGNITGKTALGESFGSGTEWGLGMIGSNGLAMMRESFLTNNSSYGGMTISEIGPYPLVQNTSFASYEGSTLSALASTFYGAALHELSHGFGLPHDFRNDEWTPDPDGNVMGFGLRGFRGALFPQSYPANDTFLSYGHALALSTSRYFNPAPAAETTRPFVLINTSGSVPISGGKLNISFTASDSSGLAVAWLRRNDVMVAEMPLSGMSVSRTFSIAEYDLSTAATFQVDVFDIYGNRYWHSSLITALPGNGNDSNRAAKPAIDANQTTLGLGQTLTLDASRSEEPDSGQSLAAVKVEWDLNNDGTYDTPPTTTKTHSTFFTTPGTRIVRARLTDQSGATSLSAPLPIRILPAYFGSSASDSVTIAGNADPDLLTITAGAKTFTMPRSQTFRFSGGGGTDWLTVAASAGLAGVDLGAGGVNLTLQSGAAVKMSASQTVGTLALQGSALLTLEAGSGMLLSTGSFAFSSTARLDVQDNQVAVLNPAQVNVARGLLLSGRAGGAWNGAGIFSSIAAASPLPWGLMLTPESRIVSGQVGDIDGSGVLDGDDYFFMDYGFELQAQFSDLTFDGRVDIDDYFAMDTSIARWSQAGYLLSVFRPDPIFSPEKEFVLTSAPAPGVPELQSNSSDQNDFLLGG